MSLYLPSPAAKEILDSVSSMSSSIIMKDDGVRCQQVSSLPLSAEIARDTLQRMSADDVCCRAVTTRHQKKWKR
jgi:hypothetical protein